MEGARDLSAAVSGYLCGTHSGVVGLRLGRKRRSDVPETVATMHRRLVPAPEVDEVLELGQARWIAQDHREALATSLRAALAHNLVIDLVFFGSQARGGLTGFSDVDAILIIRNEAADHPANLRALRPRVLAAQRAVLAYQPMQHHGFQVVTPKLLAQAAAALGLPAVAVSETRSLNGSGHRAHFERRDASSFDVLAASLARLHTWPAHPWEVHRHVAMFELLPVAYLQRRGMRVPKWRSFGAARSEFGGEWWPYDVLREVRESWPRLPRPMLDLGSALARNPWTALAAWRRLPASLPDPVRPLLTPKLLEGLQNVVRLMQAQAR